MVFDGDLYRIGGCVPYSFIIVIIKSEFPQHIRSIPMDVDAILHDFNNDDDEGNERYQPDVDPNDIVADTRSHNPVEVEYIRPVVFGSII